MFWSSDASSTRRSQSTDNRSFKLMTTSTQSQSTNPQGQTRMSNPKKDLEEKVQKFISINKKHEFDEVCVCEDCIYAKQLQKYQTLKMDLSKNSSYRAQYNKNHLKKSFSITEDLKESNLSNKPQEGNISKNPYVHIDSVYRNEYASRSVGKVEKVRPTDELKFTGPSTAFSSYNQMYQNLNGPYQYVEPAKDHVLPSLKFNGESLYSNSFKPGKVVETESAKMNDQLRLGKPSIVTESTQRSQYANPQSSYSKYDRYCSSRQRRLQNPNFSFQYKTIHQDEFEKPVQKKNCRSKRMQVLHGHMVASQNFSTIN